MNSDLCKQHKLFLIPAMIFLFHWLQSTGVQGMVRAGLALSSAPTWERPIHVKQNLWGKLENQAHIFMQM